MAREVMVGARMEPDEVEALDQRVAQLQQQTPGKVTRSDVIRLYAVEGLRRDGVQVGKVQG